jgi:hypothetical protein
MMMKTAVKWVLTGSILLALTGCASQIAALKPVGGDALAGVRTVTIDLVLAKGYEFVEAPVCTQDETKITCLGSTTENNEVASVSLLDGNTNVTVTVDGETLYQGSISEVLEKAVRGEL